MYVYVYIRYCYMFHSLYVSYYLFYIFVGKHYTPEYCQTRCASLRDQYSREKRNMKNDYKSGSACSKRKTFAFLSQLSFLENFIQRRR